MVNKVLFSSNSDEWSTPEEIYNELDQEFNFNLDPCSTAENHKTEEYYTIADNGLIKSWGGVESFVILLTQLSESGLKKRITSRLKRILLSYF